MSMINWKEEAAGIAEELKEIRKTIHRHPEIGNREYKTSALVEEYLQELGIKTRRVLGTAIIGELAGSKDGPVVALRADMDALPVQERTGCDFSSEVPGMMHACGHDVHTTALLGAAKLLALHKEDLPGTVRFFFQPDEEGDGGAQRMIREGCMENVSAVFGAHVDPTIPAGQIGIRYGKFYAASDSMDVFVHGKSAHGATRELGIDAIEASCKMIPELLKLPEILLPEKSALSIGAIRAGTVRNIVADYAEFHGIIRTLGRDSRQKLLDALKEKLTRISDEAGTRIELVLNQPGSGIVNTDPETKLCEKTAVSLLGKDHIVMIKEPKMISEDFGFFVEECGAGCFYHIGAESPYPLHSDHFLPSEEGLEVGAALHAAIAMEYLKERENQEL